MVAGYRDGGIILAVSPSLLFALVLPSESSLHTVPWLGATYYIGSSFCMSSYR